MKKNIKFLSSLLIINISCTSINYQNHPRWFCSKKVACLKHPRLTERPDNTEVSSFFNNSDANLTYEDFPNEALNVADSNYKERLTDANHRIGKIRNGYKEGKWLAGNVDFDENGNVESEGVSKEEYFKNGLRDSIFRHFDSEGKIIYETTFKMGTGLWKEFHSNGKLYFEAYTKDGYLTDTLKLYDFRGRLQDKLLYKKDSLVYSQNFDTNIVDTLENGEKVRITYKKHWKDSYKQPYYIFEKKYPNKIVRFQYPNKLIYYKTDTLINKVKKEFIKSIKEDKIGEKTEENVYTYSQKPNEKTFEYYKLYRKGKLIKYRYFLKANKKETPKITTIGYKETGEIAYRSTLNTENFKTPYPQKWDKTTYFEKGKQVFYSEEIIEKAVIDERQQGVMNVFKQIYYYDLKNILLKKEFIKYSQGEHVESCSQGSATFEVDEMIIQKTEYYEKGKLIKTEEAKTP
jgi:antitoxin component YwqK of YwqJK toxin-antitoxin module